MNVKLFYPETPIEKTWNRYGHSPVQPNFNIVSLKREGEIVLIANSFKSFI